MACWFVVIETNGLGFGNVFIWLGWEVLNGKGFFVMVKGVFGVMIGCCRCCCRVLAQVFSDVALRS
jgi:hypothetical protein